MKVDSIKDYHILYKQYDSSTKEARNKSVNIVTGCESADKSVNTGYYRGSSISFGAAPKLSKGMKLLKKINTLCQDHKVIAQNLVALVLAVGFRPIAIISLPGKKNKDDKIYASGHSIASGLIGFIFSSIVMYPLGIAAKKYMKEVESIKDTLQEMVENKNIKTFSKKELLKGKEFIGENFLNIFGEFDKNGKLIKINRKTLERTTSILEMAPDTFVFGVAKAMLTVALIPPILKYVFGVEKHKEKVPVTDDKTKLEKKSTEEQKNITNYFSKVPSMKNFLGGVK